MKKLALLLVTVMFVSCGGDKGKGSESVEKPNQNTDEFTVAFQGIYEKDDEIHVQIKKDGYFDYENPIKQKVTGQALIQRITIDVPQGVSVQNIQFYLSTNKEQKKVQLKSVSILNNGKEVFNGDNFNYLQYFNGNPGVIMDEQTQMFNLDFSGQFPPGFTGNEKLEQHLAK